MCAAVYVMLLSDVEKRKKIAEKVLGETEVQKGFIQIPLKSLKELTKDTHIPAETLLNGERARLDGRGRLWSSPLKRKFEVGSQIQLVKTKEGFQVELTANREYDFPSSQHKDEVPEPPRINKKEGKGRPPRKS